jgi:hypothetical protein
MIRAIRAAAALALLVLLAGAAGSARGATARPRAAHGAAPITPVSAAPPLDLRATPSGFPFWLGTTMYGNQWKVAVEGSDWWFDRAHWDRAFAELEKLRIDALVLMHPHPYPALVELPEYPEARCLDPATFARSKEMMHWIIDQGRRHGVRLYFLTWNICLPPGFCAKHHLPEFGADTPVARAYTRAAVAATFREYPGLGGLITEAGETPPGCVDFVEKAICAGMRDSGTNPELIFWGWCSYPVDSRRIMAAWPHTRLMHYLQYEQFFRPQADPRIGRFSRACGNAPMVVIGGPKSCHGYLLWADPEWAWRTVRSLRGQNVNGFVIENYHEDIAIGREALAYYASHPGAPYDAAYWARRIGEQYGRRDLGPALLDAMQHASRILPRFVTLVHSQTDHYMPQFGLPLIYYLEMPTLSSYVFENVQTLDAKGYLRPNLGLCWPNPDWGERVASVKEFVAGRYRPRATTPPAIADEIDALAARCAADVERVRRQLKPSDGAYIRRLLDLLTLNAALGQHFAAKIRAAVAWERFRRGKGAGQACVASLSASVAAWERVVAVADRIYPGSLRFWRSELASAPPWSQNQIWASYAMVEGSWRENLELFRRELAMVTAEVSQDRRLASLPLWENLRETPPAQLKPLFADDFARRDGRTWEWGPGASCVRTAGQGVSGAAQAGSSAAGSGSGAAGNGSGAARMDSRGLPGEWHMMLEWKPGAVRLLPGKRYQLTFRYRVVDPGRDFADPFAVAARSDRGGVPADIGTGRTWGAAKGAIGRRTVVLQPEKYDNYRLFFSIHGHAAVEIDELRVGECP